MKGYVILVAISGTTNLVPSLSASRVNTTYLKIGHSIFKSLDELWRLYYQTGVPGY